MCVRSWEHVQFNHVVVNDFYSTLAEDEDELSSYVNEITDIITWRLIQLFLDHPKRLSAANLTSLYSVLHKPTIHNWTPSTKYNSGCKSTSSYLVGTRIIFNFEKLVFKTVLKFVDKGGEMGFVRIHNRLMI